MGRPARFGIVDMGSHALRFLIAETDSSGDVTVLENHRIAVSLGRDVFGTGRIAEATIATTVDAFRRFQTNCDRLAVQHTRAIATSAMRDAINRQLLADRVREATGIEVETISGTQEAYLLKLGVESRLDLSQGRSLLVDLGGGSVEVMVVENGNVVAADSYRFGPLRMLSTLAGAEASGDSLVQLMHRHVRSLDRPVADRLDGRRIDRYAATGGNIDSLADLALGGRRQQTDGDVDHVALRDIEAEIESLSEMSVADRIDKRGLREDRADTIVPAGIVYTHLAQLAGVDEILVPRTGIKDGLLAEVVRGH